MFSDYRRPATRRPPADPATARRRRNTRCPKTVWTQSVAVAKYRPCASAASKLTGPTEPPPTTPDSCPGGRPNQRRGEDRGPGSNRDPTSGAPFLAVERDVAGLTAGMIRRVSGRAIASRASVVARSWSPGLAPHCQRGGVAGASLDKLCAGAPSAFENERRLKLLGGVIELSGRAREPPGHRLTWAPSDGTVPSRLARLGSWGLTRSFGLAGLGFGGKHPFDAGRRDDYAVAIPRT